jgi:hypothetical protein
MSYSEISMGTVTWVHLSDWHQRGVDFDRKVVRDALLRDIEERCRNISEDLRRIDFVAFSGDLAFSGKREEYRVALQEFIGPILIACGLVGNGKPRLDRFFLVPGNHDVDRDLASLLRTNLRFFSDRAKLLGALGSDHARRIVLGPMQAYEEFVRADLSGAGCGRCTDYGFQCRFDVDGVSIFVVGLNSAWLCGTNNDSSGEIDDYGNILVGEMQLDLALRDPEKSDLVIGMLHHPFNWLALKDGVKDRIRIRDRLMNECHVILHGHEHELAVSAYVSTYGNCVIIPCGSSYDRRDRANGYNLCTVDLDTHEGRAYLRRFDADRRWLPDIRTSRPNADGSFPFQIPIKTDEDAPVVAKTGATVRAASSSAAPSPKRASDNEFVFVTSTRRDSVRTLPSDVLRSPIGGISVGVYVSPFGSGIRRLVNNRYIISHAVSTRTPYSNVVSVARGPRRFSAEDIKAPTWRVWLVNDDGVSRVLWIDDTEQIKVGWHNFVLRWDHGKPLLELLIDGRTVIAEPNYAEAWPARFVTDITLGAWPSHGSEHYLETCIAHWRAVEQPFEDKLIETEIKGLASLPACDLSERL